MKYQFVKLLLPGFRVYIRPQLDRQVFRCDRNKRIYAAPIIKAMLDGMLLDKRFY